MLPADVVVGVGAVDEPVPPVAAVYHSKLLPVAVKAVAVAPSQYVTGVVTVGADGGAFTVTAIAALGLSQPAADVWLT